ncbi:DprA-like DNA processing chain A [Streptomyces phage Sham]|nr:DprA-like DNA processing chain A [Streptomyces phage Sham]
MRVGITGHRPERLEDHEDAVKQLISEALVHFGATRLYQGMAAGADLWSAKEAWKLKIPYAAVRPWAGHKPRVADTIEYGKVLKHATAIIDVDPSIEYPGPWVYNKRNEYIVDEVHAMIAVWDGRPYGGTYNCIEYAWKKAIPVLRIDPEERELGYISEEVPF